MKFTDLPFALLLIASSLSSFIAQPESWFPGHCLPRIASDPALDPQSCAIALNEFDSDNHNDTGLFTNILRGPGTLQLPRDRTYQDCRLRIELLYANEVAESVHDVWAQGDVLNHDCVFPAGYIGGRIFVNSAGLMVTLLPAGDNGEWEERFNTSSITVGQDNEGVTILPGATIITAETGGGSP